jgi:hypothetical protein
MIAANENKETMGVESYESLPLDVRCKGIGI